MKKIDKWMVQEMAGKQEIITGYTVRDKNGHQSYHGPSLSKARQVLKARPGEILEKEYQDGSGGHYTKRIHDVEEQVTEGAKHAKKMNKGGALKGDDAKKKQADVLKNKLADKKDYLAGQEANKKAKAAEKIGKKVTEAEEQVTAYQIYWGNAKDGRPFYKKSEAEEFLSKKKPNPKWSIKAVKASYDPKTKKLVVSEDAFDDAKKAALEKLKKGGAKALGVNSDDPMKTNKTAPDKEIEEAANGAENYTLGHPVDKEYTYQIWRTKQDVRDLANMDAWVHDASTTNSLDDAKLRIEALKKGGSPFVKYKIKRVKRTGLAGPKGKLPEDASCGGTSAGAVAAGPAAAPYGVGVQKRVKEADSKNPDDYEKPDFQGLRNDFQKMRDEHAATKNPMKLKQNMFKNIPKDVLSKAGVKETAPSLSTLQNVATDRGISITRRKFLNRVNQSTLPEIYADDLRWLVDPDDRTPLFKKDIRELATIVGCDYRDLLAVVGINESNVKENFWDTDNSGIPGRNDSEDDGQQGDQYEEKKIRDAEKKKDKNPVKEGKVKELDMDFKELSPKAFKAKYKQTKSEMSAKMQPKKDDKKVNEAAQDHKALYLKHEDLADKELRKVGSKLPQAWDAASLRKKLSKDPKYAPALKHLKKSEHHANQLAKQKKGKGIVENMARRAFRKHLLEGTWAFPDSPEQKKLFDRIMTRPLYAGVAQRVLYNVFGDDRLFDLIEQLKSEDGAGVDVRKAVMDRYNQLCTNKDCA